MALACRATPHDNNSNNNSDNHSNNKPVCFPLPPHRVNISIKKERINLYIVVFASLSIVLFIALWGYRVVRRYAKMIPEGREVTKIIY